MALLTVTDVHNRYGPCRVVDAHGDVLLGSIVECDPETGVYVVMRRGDDGKLLFSPGMTLAYERCEAQPPLTLVPLGPDE